MSREAARLVNRGDLLTIPKKSYWHFKMMCYGPSGIGSGRRRAGFVDCHQQSFKVSFPHRSSAGNNNYTRMGDG